MLTFPFTLLSEIMLLVGVLGSFYLIAATYAVFYFSHQRPVTNALTIPITILKPLCGNEHNLRINLRSFCMQDYPVYQIVFGVQDADDKALNAVHSLIAEFPEIDIAIVIDSTRSSYNMKVANLQNMFSTAKHDYLVMADSDTHVGRNYLSHVSAPLADPSVGAVTCLYRGVSDGGFWSDMGCAHINYGFLPQAILGDMLSIGRGCFGATIAMRRDTLAQIGGFATIGNVLADDHELGVLIRQHGKSVVLSSYVIDNIISEPNLPSLFKHETRWARTIRTVQPGGYIGSVLTHPVALGMIGALCSPETRISIYVLAGIVLMRFMTAALIKVMLGLSARFLWLLPLRDIMSFFVFLNGFIHGTVKWRSNTFRVTRNGRITLDGDLAA